jgi:hypothetical protein
LASIALQTEALAKLKFMLSRYIGKGKHNDDSSPSKTFLENHVTLPSVPLPPPGEKDGRGLRRMSLNTTSTSLPKQGIPWRR